LDAKIAPQGGQYCKRICIKDFIDRSGKGLRPALCIATARALGGRTEDAFPAAAGLEMLHNAFPVHDDNTRSVDLPLQRCALSDGTRCVRCQSATSTFNSLSPPS
jgi:hypothetical protein